MAHLDLGRNPIGVLEEGIGACKALTNLSVSQSPALSQLPSDLSKLAELEDIAIQGCHCTTIPAMIFAMH